MADTLKRVSSITANIQLGDTQNRWVYVVFHNPGGIDRLLCGVQSNGNRQASCDGRVPITPRPGGNSVNYEFFMYQSIGLSGTQADYVDKSNPAGLRIYRQYTNTNSVTEQLGYSDTSATINLQSRTPSGAEFAQNELIYGFNGQNIPWQKYE